MDRHISRSLAFAFVCAGFLALPVGVVAYTAPDKGPPKGISSTTASLQGVLAAAGKADGSDRTYSSSIEEGRVAAWDLKGTFRDVYSGDDYKSTIDLGAIRWQRGRLNGQLWRQNENGLVIMLHDARWSDEADAEAIAKYRKHPSSDLELLGETSGPGAAYVVEVHPLGERLEWLFFDKKSYLVTRAEVVFSDERATYTYSDYHKTGPYTDAWHIHIRGAEARNDEDYLTVSKRYDVAVAPADTAMPQSNDKLVQFPAGVNVVTLPAKVLGMESRLKIGSYDSGTKDITMPGNMSSTYTVQETTDPKIIVQLTINGRGYDFFLDSGAGGIFIDSDQALKLGLRTFGPSAQTKFGTWVRSFALIPDIRVGTIQMSNVLVNLLPSWHDDPHVGTEIVGLVGYDFIANAVLTIDYEKGTVTATNPYLFVPPADALALPASFDEGVPYIPVQVGQASSDHFILDTGSPNCFLFSSFADAHPDDVKDQGSGVNVNHVWMPWNGFSGVAGGEQPVRATEVKSLTVSGVTFNDWIMFMDLTKQSPGDEEAGLIGYDFLKYFTVYLDYPQNQVFLAPNGRARGKSQGGR